MSSFINRRLAKIERDLQDVLDYQNRQLLRCPACGAYHAHDLNGEIAAHDLQQMLEKVRYWQTEDWTQE